MQKESVIHACRLLIKERIGRIEAEMATSREAANNETKSSAGDKFETTRAMMHAELEKLSGQLHNLQQQLAAINQAEQTKKTAKAGLGSLVETTNALYFIAVGLGAIDVEGTQVFCISLPAPIGKLLLGKAEGDAFLFNGKKQVIKRIT